MQTVNKLLENEIVSFNTHIDNILRTDNEVMQEIMDWILQSRGKQLRPKLVCLAARFGKKGADATKMAAILEIIHTASLVHDDIIDDADTRRGQLSVQKKYGRHMAVYAGDFMIFNIIDETFNDLKKKNFSEMQAYQRLYSVVQQLCYGEIGQDKALFQSDVTEDIYVYNIKNKTASLFRTACELGAQVAKAPAAVIDALSTYGDSLGLLFQIRDDLLDYRSTEEEIGKPILQDYARGIYTLPLIYALQNESLRDEVLATSEYIKANGLSADTAKKVMNIVDQADGITKTRAKATQIYREAMDVLSKLPDKEETQCLIHILNKVYAGI